MASRSSVQGFRIARLKRTARLAGESFGHEELGPLSPLRSGMARLALIAGAALFIVALAVISLP